MKILDFGLAKLLSQPRADSEADTMTKEGTVAGAVMGTASYMSPEQALGKPLDARTDVFSLGAVLYEMATGSRPFQGETLAGLFNEILNKTPSPPSSLISELPQAVDHVIQKCLDKNPQQRYQSATEVREALGGLGILASQPSVIRRQVIPRFARRHWALRAGIVAPTVLVAIAVGIWLSREPPTPEAETAVVEESVDRDPHSIAVLPFSDLSPGRDQEYFSDGLTEELLNTLVQIRDLKVVGRTSSFQFKGKNEDLRVIGEKLNVAMILEGSVRKSNGQARITAQLVSAGDGFHVWSETYDTELNDIFAVQEAIARSVAEASKGPLLGQDAEATRPEGENAEAYNLYLQGRHFARRMNEKDLERAISYFEKALALDPHFARAWVGLASAKRTLAGRGYVATEDVHREALRAVERALEMDDSLAEAWAALGTIKSSFDWDWAAADTAYQRALELNSGSADILTGAGMLAADLGRLEEAIELTRRALELDPLRAYSRANLGIFLLNASRLKEAENALLEELEMYPDSLMTHSILGLVYLAAGRPVAARDEMERESDPVFRLQGLAIVHGALGQRDAADAALAELIEKHQSLWPFQIAEVYAYRNEADEAFAWLERAYMQRDSGLGQMKTDWLLTSLHDDPRWTAFLKKMGLAN